MSFIIILLFFNCYNTINTIIIIINSSSLIIFILRFQILYSIMKYFFVILLVIFKNFTLCFYTSIKNYLYYFINLAQFQNFSLIIKLLLLLNWLLSICRNYIWIYMWICFFNFLQLWTLIFMGSKAHIRLI